MRRGPRAFAADETGTAILEFALALPILIALVFAGFELGRALLIQGALEAAVRGGARFLARAPDPTCRPTCSPGAAHAVALTRGEILANTGLGPDAVAVRPLPEPPPGTVVMSAEAAFRVAFLSRATGRAVWTLAARHQEQRVAE